MSKLVTRSLLFGLWLVSFFIVQVCADEKFDQLIEQKNYSQAINYADESIPAAQRTGSIWAKLGIAHEEQGMIEKALACFMVATRTDPKNYEAYLGAARIYNKMNQPSSALPMAKKAMELKASGEASWEYARACIGLGKSQDAKVALEKVVETDQLNVVATRELGTIYYQEKNYQRAIPLLKSSYDSKADPETALRIGRAYKETGDIPNAIDYYQRATRDKKPKFEAVVELAQLYVKQNQFKSASDEYAKVDQAQLSADDLYTYAISIEKVGSENDKALRIYDLAAKKYGTVTSPNALRAREKLGRERLSKKDYRNALIHLEVIFRADPEGRVVEDVQFLYAEALDGSGDSRRAIPILEKIVAKDKDNVEANARLADMYSKSGQTDKAQVLYQRLSTLQPNSAKVYLALGEYHLKSRKFEDALKSFQKGFNLEPSARAAQGMMAAAWELRRYDLARDAAESALHRDPNLREPQIILAKIYMQEKNYGGAKSLLEKLVKAEPDNKDLWLQLAECYEKSNDSSKLADADRKIMYLDKNNIVSRVRFAKYSANTGDTKLAIETYRELAALEPSNAEHVKNLYELSLKGGNKNEAIGYLKSYVTMRPSNAGAQRDLGNLLYERKDAAGALNAYRAALKADPTIKGFYKNYVELVLALKGDEKEVVSALTAAIKAGESNEEIYTTLGRIYEKQTLYVPAIDMFQKALMLKPQNFENLAALARCQEKAGRSTDAILSYEQAVAMNPNSTREQKSLGDIYWSVGKKSQGSAAYKRYLDKNPTDSKVALLVGNYEFDQKNFKDAARYLSMVSGEEAKSADHLWKYGFATYQTGDFRKTSELFRALVVLTPKNPEPYRILFEIAKKENNLPLAADYLGKFAALKPNDATTQQQLGDMYYDLKNTDAALGAYRATLAANPGAKGFYKKYVELLRVKGTPDELIRALTGAINASEADASMYSQLGDLYRKSGNHQKAVQILQKASQMDPRNSGLLFALAESQAKSGDINNAVITYEQALALNPNNDNEYRTLGNLYMQQKKTDAAMRSYKKYLEKSPDSDLAKVVGENSYANKNFAEAIRFFGMVKGDQARTASFKLMFADAAYQAKDDMKALSLYKDAADVAPQNSLVYKKLYEISNRMGDKDAALSYLRKYASLNPADAQSQRYLGDLLYEKKDNAGAIAAYRATLKVDPNAKGFYSRYAELVMMSGSDAEVVSAINGAIAANEANVKMYARLGEIYKKQGLYPKAVQMFEKAVQLDPKSIQLLFSLAECQGKAGNVPAAIISFEQALAFSPSAVQEYKTLGDLYMQQNKPDQAVRSYKKYLEKNPDNGVAAIVGDYSYRQKNYQDAIKYFGIVSGEKAKDVNFMLTYADACYQGKDDQRALGLYRQITVIAPQNALVYNRLYEISNRTGEKENALSFLKKYALLSPGDITVQRKLGDLLFERKDVNGALTAYRTLLKADPNVKGIYKNYAELVLTSQVSDEEKIRVLSGAVSANEADARVYETLADTYRKQNLCAKAIPLYERASQLDSRSLRILTSLADCQMKTGAVKEATITLEQVVAVNNLADKEYKMLGDLYMQQKKTDAAMRSYKKYLEKVPNDYTLAMKIGEQAYENKNYSEAVKYFSMVSGTNARSPEFLKMYGQAAFMIKDDTRALQIYKDLSITQSKDPFVYQRLYEISNRSGNSDAALSYLRSYLILKPTDAQGQKNLGDQLYDRKDQAGALNAYRAALKADPSLKGFYKRYVELTMVSGTQDEKIKALSSAIAANEGDMTMYKQLGDLYRKAGNYQQAIPMIEKASQMDPRNADLLSALAECQMKTGQTKEAAITYEQALAMNPGAVKEYKALGDLYMQQKNMDAAITAYKKYLDKQPNDNDVALIIAKRAYSQKKYEDAFKYFAMIKNDNSPEYLAAYGLSAIEIRNFPIAIDVLERLRATKGGTVPRDVAYKALADAYDRAGNQVKAAEVLNDYVKLPGVRDPEASYKRAMVYEKINAAQAAEMYEENTVAYPRDYRNFLKLGAYYSRQSSTSAKAVKMFEKAAALADTVPRIWIELGTLYSKMNRDQDMLKAYRKYIEVDPENAENAGKIGESLLAKKMTDDAMVFLEMANALKENDPKIMTLLARGYLMTNRRQEGAKILEKVVRLTRGDMDDDLRLVLADVYLETGKYREAADELKIILDKKRDNNAALLKYAKVLTALERYDEATEAIETIKATQPENIEAHMVLGSIYQKRKKYNEAIETYKEVLYIDQNYAPALCARADVYSIQGKIQWAKTFYERTLKADPKNAMAELGLALLAKSQKDYATYQDHLERAKKLDPQNKAVQDELRSSKR